MVLFVVSLLLFMSVFQLVRPAALYHGCGHLLIQFGDGVDVSQQFPSSKSGSWGGHPAAAVLMCKPYSQTC